MHYGHIVPATLVQVVQPLQGDTKPGAEVGIVGYRRGHRPGICVRGRDIIGGSERRGSVARWLGRGSVARGAIILLLVPGRLWVAAEVVPTVVILGRSRVHRSVSLGALGCVCRAVRRGIRILRRQTMVSGPTRFVHNIVNRKDLPPIVLRVQRFIPETSISRAWICCRRVTAIPKPRPIRSRGWASAVASGHRSFDFSDAP